MKKIIVLTCLLFSCSGLSAFLWKAGDSIAFRDSVLNEVEHLPSDTSRLSYLLNVAYLHQYPPCNIRFADTLYKEAVKQKNVFYENQGAYFMAACYDKKHDLDSLLYWVDRLKELASETGKYDYYLEQKAAVSRVYASKQLIEKAEHTAKEVLKESEERHSNNGMVAAYNSLGCAYSVSKREEESLEMLLRGYRLCHRQTKLSLHIDILSRLVSRYADKTERDSALLYLDRMDGLLNVAIAREPETADNWRDVMVDCQTKYVRHYMGMKDYAEAFRYVEKAKELLTPTVDSVYWLNVRLMEIQLLARTKEYDKAVALIDEVASFVESDHVSTFEMLLYYKSLVLRDKGDWDAGIRNLKHLLHKQDSLNYAFSMNQLKQVKEIYHIDELLLEKQKITNTNYMRAILVLAILLGMMALFYIYTRVLSRKIAQAEKAAAEAAALSNADNQAKERLRLEISHDIRTPLNAVVGFAEILADADSLDEESKAAYNKIIQENAAQLLEYVNNILELSRLESGKIQYGVERCEFVSLCREAAAMANVAEQNCTQVELQTEIEEQVIDTDKARFLLLLNSLMVSTTDTEFFHVTVTVRRVEEKSLLLVSAVNTPLARERFENKTAMIRNEINAHFIHHFGGYYKVDALAKGGPAITFTYPYVGTGKKKP